MSVKNDIYKLFSKEDNKQILISEFQKALDNFFEDEILEILKKVSKFKNGKETIFNSLEIIYKKIDVEEIPDIIELIPEIEIEKLKFKNNYVYEMYNDELIDKETLGIILKSNTSKSIEILLKTLSEGQKIEKVGRGTYSYVLKTNGYIVKIGETREMYDLPYSNSILQPILRDRLQDQNGNTIFVIEVQPEADIKNITDENLDIIKNELKKVKVKWLDKSVENLGRLKKDNHRIIPKGYGGIIETDNDEKIKKTGDVVVIDADLLKKEEIER